ncbi:Centaurin-gamma-1A isoform X1 [Aphelenchoides fujianensis]|nr:Centaurin-gamma-1A isoform X1 [Aphelenchoides fujianensis]
MAFGGVSDAHQLSVTKQVNDEILRFESVHPYIYRAYNLINSIENPVLREQLEKEVVLIEDAFIRSQEWTLTRNVPSIHLGVVGSLDSGKTPLIHRYLTGKFRVQESAEGGRFKKEVVVDNQCHLLLIRDEGKSAARSPRTLPSSPSFFTHWFDGVLVVFSVVNRQSFEVAKHFVTVMADYRRSQDYPVIVVGTVDALTPTTRRIVSEEEAKRYALERNCGYIEVCSLLGNNVENTFRTICKSITNAQMDAAIAYRRSYRTGTTPMSGSHSASTKQRNRIPVQADFGVNTPTKNKRPPRGTFEPGHISHTRSMSAAPVYDAQQLRPVEDQFQQFNNQFANSTEFVPDSSFNSYRQRGDMSGKQDYHLKYAADDSYAMRNRMVSTPGPSSDRTQDHNFLIPGTRSVASFNGAASEKKGTPKNHPQARDSQLDAHQQPKRKDQKPLPDGQGREIPLKQGYLYKRGNARITWKKKYAFQEQSSQMKEVFLGLAMVRVPNAQNQHRNRRSSLLNVFKSGKENMGPGNALANSVSSIAPPAATDRASIASDTNGGATSTPGEESSGGGMSDLELGNLPTEPMPSTVNESKRKKKKHHRRLASFGVRPNEDDEDNEFEIITSDQRRLEFSAASSQERDEWVALIGQQIAKALTSQSGRCADCGSNQPVWAAYNHGITICIECSGIHRKLGTHVSKVRSLELDQWPQEYVNHHEEDREPEGERRLGEDPPAAREDRAERRDVSVESKVTADECSFCRTDRSNFIENKYVRKAYVGTPQLTPRITLLDAIQRRDFDQFARVLPLCTKSEFETADETGRTPAHYAALAALPEFLLLLSWNQANLTKKDGLGKTALEYAIKSDALNPHVLSDIRPSSSDEIHSSVANNNFPVPAPRAHTPSSSGFPRAADSTTYAAGETGDARNEDPNISNYSQLPSSVL